MKFLGSNSFFVYTLNALWSDISGHELITSIGGFNYLGVWVYGSTRDNNSYCSFSNLIRYVLLWTKGFYLAFSVSQET